MKEYIKNLWNSKLITWSDIVKQNKGMTYGEILKKLNN